MPRKQQQDPKDSDVQQDTDTSEVTVQDSVDPVEPTRAITEPVTVTVLDDGRKIEDF